jgi:hypothetical protein
MDKNNIINELNIMDLNTITKSLKLDLFKTSFGYGLKSRRY